MYIFNSIKTCSVQKPPQAHVFSFAPPVEVEKRSSRRVWSSTTYRWELVRKRGKIIITMIDMVDKWERNDDRNGILEKQKWERHDMNGLNMMEK